MDHAISALPETVKKLEGELISLNAQRERAKEEVKKSFPREEEYRQKSARLHELDRSFECRTSRGHDADRRGYFNDCYS